jgi:hypothetical protein
MHLWLLGIPAPTSVRINCNVGIRVELKLLQAFVTRAGSAVLDISVP